MRDLPTYYGFDVFPVMVDAVLANLGEIGVGNCIRSSWLYCHFAL